MGTTIPDWRTKTEEANGKKSYLSTTSNSSLNPPTSLNAVSRTEVTSDEPSWLQGMFQSDMEEESAFKDDYQIPPNTSTSQKFLYCYVTHDGKELNEFIEQATWVTVNDYEWQMMRDKTVYIQKVWVH